MAQFVSPVVCVLLCSSTPSPPLTVPQDTIVYCHAAGDWQAGLQQLCTAGLNLQVLDITGNTLIEGEGCYSSCTTPSLAGLVLCLVGGNTARWDSFSRKQGSSSCVRAGWPGEQQCRWP
jgi:hypothetical protein